MSTEIPDVKSRSSETLQSSETLKLPVESSAEKKKSLSYDGNLLYAYDTNSGIYAYQAAAPKLLRTGMLAFGVEGSYSYTSPDGTKVTVTYTADENGYHPKVSISRH